MFNSFSNPYIILFLRSSSLSLILRMQLWTKNVYIVMAFCTHEEHAFVNSMLGQIFLRLSGRGLFGVPVLWIPKQQLCADPNAACQPPFVWPFSYVKSLLEIWLIHPKGFPTQSLFDRETLVSSTKHSPMRRVIESLLSENPDTALQLIPRRNRMKKKYGLVSVFCNRRIDGKFMSRKAIW